MATKKGSDLKLKLGLEKLNNVRMTRLLISTFRVYMVFYDSRMPTRPITNSEIKKLDYVYFGLQPPFDTKPMFLPLYDIEDFGGSLNTAMFFVIDLAGRFRDPKKVTKKFESSPVKPLYLGRIEEFLTLADLKNNDATSSFTKRTRKERNDAVGTENRQAKLIDVNLDPKLDHVTFVWLTEVTEPIYPSDYKFQQADPDDNFDLDRNTSKTYELHIRILEFFSWLKTKPDLKKITGDDVKEVLRIANVQVWSNGPDFHWQGGNYFMSQLDAAIYPTSIAPKFWNQSQFHGQGPYFSSKHLYGLIRGIDFWVNPMASMLTKKLKERKLI